MNDNKPEGHGFNVVSDWWRFADHALNVLGGMMKDDRPKIIFAEPGNEHQGVICRPVGQHDGRKYSSRTERS